MKTLSKNPSLTAVCLKVIGNLLTGELNDIEELLNYGVINALEFFLDSQISMQQKEAVWALSNIAASNKAHIERLINSSAFAKVLEKIKSLSKINMEILLECVWTLSNAVSGADIELVIKLLDLDALNIFISVLERVENDMILVVALNGLNSLFRLGEPLKQLNFQDANPKNPIIERFLYLGGHLYLEKLMNHKSTEVYSITYEIIKDYFSYGEQEVVEIGYNNDGNNSQNNNRNGNIN